MSEQPAEQGSTPVSGAQARVALTEGQCGIIGVKAGMTHVYNDNGDLVAVTVIDLKPNVITQVRTHATDGYNGIQVGVIEKNEKHSSKPEQGHAKKSGQKGYTYYKEFRLPAKADLSKYTVGSVLTAEFVKPGDLVDLCGVSKGKGFQGVMKRHHYGGQNATHGCSVTHRSAGSIGNRADPGKVFKGKQMSGQMGHKKVTIQNVKVVKVDTENSLVLVHGTIPGPRSSFVTVRKAIKSLEKK